MGAEGVGRSVGGRGQQWGLRASGEAWVGGGTARRVLCAASLRVERAAEAHPRCPGQRDSANPPLGMLGPLARTFTRALLLRVPGSRRGGWAWAGRMKVGAEGSGPCGPSRAV